MAPSWIASFADSQPAYAVRRMTSASGQWARAARSTSRPSPSGMRRSVTMTSKASSVRALTAAPTPSASVTRWLRFRSSSARVVRAEASSSTTRIAAISHARGDRQHDGEARALAGRRLDVDPPPVRGDDAPGDGEPEAGAAPLPGVEGLEDPPALLDRNPAAGVGDRDRHRELHALGATRIFPNEGRDVIDDHPDVGIEGLGLARAGEDEEVREDPVEAPRFFLDRAQRIGPLLPGEGLLLPEQGRGVDDGGQRVADLVRHARGQLARRGQALGLGEPRLQPFPLGHVGHQLEQEDLTVGLAHRGAAQREAAAVGSRDLDPHRVADGVPAVEGTARARHPVGREQLVAAAPRHWAELAVHPPVGVADPEVAVDELEALAEAVDEPLVELLERRGLAPGP